MCYGDETVAAVAKVRANKVKDESAVDKLYTVVDNLESFDVPSFDDDMISPADLVKMHYYFKRIASLQRYYQTQLKIETLKMIVDNGWFNVLTIDWIALDRQIELRS